MKVLHLIGGGDVGGAKIHVLSLVNELKKYIDVKIICFRHGVFSEEARSMGIDIEVVRTGNIIGDIRSVIHKVRNDGYEIIHSHGAKANMIAVIAGRFTKTPTVTTVHSDYRLDYMQSARKKFSFGLINKIALRFINYYIGVSNSFREMLVKRKFNPDNIFTVYNGIDFSESGKSYSRAEFSKKYNLNLTDSDIVVGILARLHPVKGLSTFIRAAKEVLAVNPSVKFLIGGEGEERRSLERQIRSLGLSGSITLLGYINDSYEFMSALDINVLSSISESFPYSILEGAKLRKATISTNVGGISDLVEHGENGYLFVPGDYRSLAGYIIELANDAEKRKEMGEKIFLKARDMFSLENMCKTQLEIYRVILSRTRTVNQCS